MIKALDLTKQYGPAVVLDIPELEIRTGERFGLVGNNGAGKTTLFSLILDLIRATKGAVHSKGLNVAQSAEWKAYTGSFLDETFLIGFLTPEEYFRFVGKLYGMNESDVFSFLEKFEAFFNGEVLGRDKYIRDLSKGNQKKTGIAAALLGSPEVIILDEPFANLDPSSQIRLKKLIGELERDKTILISSHDLAHVTEVCERIGVLEKGKLIRDIQGSADTLKELEDYFAA